MPFAASITGSRTPAEDPAFLAFLRAAGAAEGEAGLEVDYRTQQLRRQERRRLPTFGWRIQEGQEGIANDYEDRGFLGSGARQVAQMRDRRKVMHEQGEFQAEIGDKISDLNYNAALDVAKARRGVADESLLARDRIAERGAYAGVY